MKRRIHLGSALILVALSSSPACLRAQAGSPADVASLFFQALEDRRWGQAAALVLPDLLADAKPRWLENFERMVADQDTRAYAESRWLSGEFARIESLDEMRTLSPVELMARHLEALDGRAGCEEVKGTPYATPLVLRRILGVVPEGDWAHVVYRESHANLDLSAAPERYERDSKTLLLRSTPGGWRIADVMGLRVSTYCDPLVVPESPQGDVR